MRFSVLCANAPFAARNSFQVIEWIDSPCLAHTRRTSLVILAKGYRMPILDGHQEQRSAFGIAANQASISR